MDMVNNICKALLTFIVLAVPAALFAQSGNTAMLMNKTWRIIAMKCPSGVTTADNNDDQYVHYYGSLNLQPETATNTSHGNYVFIHRDQRDNPREWGSYTIVYDDGMGPRLMLMPKNKSYKPATYRLDPVNDHYLTIMSMNDADKCKVSYAVAP